MKDEDIFEDFDVFDIHNDAHISGILLRETMWAAVRKSVYTTMHPQPAFGQVKLSLTMIALGVEREVDRVNEVC